MADTLSVDQQKAMALMSMRKRASEADTPKPDGPSFPQDKPGTTYGDILPFAKGPDGKVSLAAPEAIRSPARGVQDLERMAKDAVSGKPQQDNEPRQQMTQDAAGAMMMAVPEFNSPVRAAAGKAADVAGAAASGVKDVAGKAVDSVAGDSALAKGYKARNSEALKSSTDAMKKASSKTYRAARAAGDTIPPEQGVSLVEKLRSGLTDEHGKIDPKLHSQTNDVLTDMEEHAKKGMDLEDVDNYRSRLREIADKGGKDGDKAEAAIDMMDKKVLSTPGSETWNAARKQWAKAKKFETIADIVRKSDGDINKAKKALRDLAENPKKNWAFTKEERDLIKKTGDFTTAESLLNLGGKFGFDVSSSGVKGSLGGTIGSLAALGAHSAGIIPVAGTVAKAGQNMLGRGKIEDLLQGIEKGPKTAESAIGATKDPLAIEGPREFTTDSKGSTTRTTQADANKSIKARERDKSLGISPDIRKAISEKLNNAAWNDMTEKQQERVAQEMQKAWAQNKTPIDQVIRAAKDFSESIAAAKGEKPPSGPMSQIYNPKAER